MKETVAWASRVLLLPLLPAVVGSAIRAVYSGRWDLESVDSTELAFSLALIGVILLSSVSRLTDKALRDALSPIFFIILCIALCLFAGSVLIKLVHEGEQADLLTKMKTVSSVSVDSLKQLGVADRCTRISGQIRTATLVTGILSVLTALGARLRYSLED
jgi:hypothetical protein